MQETKDELDSDNLDKYSLKESSDQDQFKKIQSAFKQQEPIVFTSMEPSWFSKELDVKMLKDPDNIYGNNNQHIDLVFNKTLKRHIQLHTQLQHVWQMIGVNLTKTN